MLGDQIQVYPVRLEDTKVLGSDPAIKGLVSNNFGSEGPLSRYQGTDLLGGFIAITPDGERLVDMSFHGLLERNEEKIREKIARTLFGDQ
jgi:vacuolar-type H+-ATPase subunit E/Vma4